MMRNNDSAAFLVSQSQPPLSLGKVVSSHQPKLEVAVNSHNSGLVIATHVRCQTNRRSLLDLISVALAFHLAVDLKHLLDSCGTHWMTKSKQSTALRAGHQVRSGEKREDEKRELTVLTGCLPVISKSPLRTRSTALN
jgi:hypothetical protein